MLRRTTQHLKLTVPAFSLALVLTACSGDHKGPKGTTLDVAEVKGVRFDTPLEQLSPTTAKARIEIDPTPVPSDASTTVAVASVSDIPADISQIPSMTPIPIDSAASTAPAPGVPTATVAQDPASSPGATQAAVATPAVPLEVPKPSTAPGTFTPIPFTVLAGFKYVEPIPMEGEKPEDVEKRRANGQIPPEILALNGSNATVEGWMVPLEITDEGHVKSFILVNKPPECCFGDMQAMNEWIDVVMINNTHAEFNVDRPIKVSGKLEVGEKTEDGFVLSVYRMQADKAEL